MKKKCLALILGTMMIFSGCTKETAAPQNEKSETLQVVATFYPVYILAKNITEGVSEITLKNMTPGESGCLHDYQMTTTDRRALDEADVLLLNGAGMEPFLEPVLSEYPDLMVVDTSEGTVPLETEHTHSHEEHAEEHEEENHIDEHAEEHEEDHAHEINSHIWLSLQNAIRQAENMRDALIEADPVHAEVYTQNTEALSERLLALKEALPTSDTSQKVAVFHEGFPYLMQDFGFSVALEMASDEHEEPSAKEMVEAVETAKKENIKLFFAANDAGKTWAETIAKEAGGTVVILDPITSGADDATAYETAMTQNLRLIKEAVEP